MKETKICPKVVFVSCVCDLLHRGHINLIKKAKSFGDFLILAPHPSYSVAQYKREPVIDTDNRMAVLRELKDVDLVICVDKEDLDRVIEVINPDVVVHGDDWLDFPGRRKAEELGIKIEVVPYTKGVSSTQLIQRCKDLEI